MSTAAPACAREDLAKPCGNIHPRVSERVRCQPAQPYLIKRLIQHSAVSSIDVGVFRWPPLAPPRVVDLKMLAGQTRHWHQPSQCVYVGPASGRRMCPTTPALRCAHCGKCKELHGLAQTTGRHEMNVNRGCRSWVAHLPAPPKRSACRQRKGRVAGGPGTSALHHSTTSQQASPAATRPCTHPPT